MFLSHLQATDEVGFPAIAYEFVKEALLLYESEITDSKVQVQVNIVVSLYIFCIRTRF